MVFKAWGTPRWPRVAQVQWVREERPSGVGAASLDSEFYLGRAKKNPFPPRGLQEPHPPQGGWTKGTGWRDLCLGQK